jgi:importin subunit alpha-6/7
MKADMLSVIIEYAKMKDFPQIQLEAVWILTNLATGTSQHLQVLIENGAL